MRKLLGIVVLGLLIPLNAFSKETSLQCDLKKYLKKETLLQDKKQVPMSEVPESFKNKEFLVLDFDNKKYINSSKFIFPMDYKSFNFSEDSVHFIGYGPGTENYFYYNSILNRYTGELTTIIKPSKIVQKKKPTEAGFELNLIYQCELTKKKF